MTQDLGTTTRDSGEKPVAANRVISRDSSSVSSHLKAKDEATSLPEFFRLEQNHPNPFEVDTTIRFQLPANLYATLQVFDVNGREVATLVNRVLPAGEHVAVFDASRLPNGVYFYRLNAGKFSHTRRAVLAR